MATYFEPVLSEEQMAAYLDGMLSPEESNMVEEIIASTPEMEEILETIDSVDSAYIYEADEEIPIECFADDFSLPDMDYYDQHKDPDQQEDSINYGDYGHHEGHGHHEDNGTTDDLSGNVYNDTDDDSQDDLNNIDYQDNSSLERHEDFFFDNSFDDLSY